MSRIDIARLRKNFGMSQSELARGLQINQSFLSAIENGRSPLPLEKEEMLMQIFGLDTLEDYVVDEVPRAVADLTEGDLIKQLLSRFHAQAHSADNADHHRAHHERIDALEQQLAAMIERLDFLLRHNETHSARNDALSARCDELRDEVDRLRRENAALRHS